MGNEVSTGKWTEKAPDISIDPSRIDLQRRNNLGDVVADEAETGKFGVLLNHYGWTRKNEVRREILGRVLLEVKVSPRTATQCSLRIIGHGVGFVENDEFEAFPEIHRGRHIEASIRVS